MSLNAGTLYISSYNNGDNDTSTKFTTTLSVPVVKAKRLRILTATLANLMMPFSDNDKVFKYNVNAVDYTVNFPTDRKWSTVSDFVTYANASVLTASTATFTYDSDKNRLSLVAVTPGQIVKMYAWNWNAAPGSSVSLNANYRLGFTSNTDLSATTTLVFDGFPNVILRTNSVYVLSNVATDSNNDANVANIIARIPVDVSWGQLIQYENKSSEFSAPVFTEVIKSVQITLLDEDYQPLINPNNAYFTLTLGIEY